MRIKNPATSRHSHPFPPTHRTARRDRPCRAFQQTTLTPPPSFDLILTMPDLPHPDRRIRGSQHIPPDWVAPDAVFFITINCQRRGIPQLTVGDLPARLFSTVSFYQNQKRWWPEILLLMPDHLHALIAFSWGKSGGMNAVVSDWKRYTARTFGIDWQRDYFDHRIRHEMDHVEKWAYIRDNPMRAGLTDSAENWPHVWFPDRVGW
jgi:putative transposase